MKNNLDQHYLNQMQLLMQVMPCVAQQACFCLKGGTAINLFIRDFPRISVDIDLVYLPQNDRVTALKEIENGLIQIKQNVIRTLQNVKVIEKRMMQGNHLCKLFIEQNYTQIVVEPNLVLRGSLYPVELRNSSDKVTDILQLQVLNVPVLNFAELYAGKICAALDRQHPRDLFDIKLLYEHEGITEQIRQAFVIYLSSGPRPMYELLNPNLLDIKSLFHSEFNGMSNITVKYEELIEYRHRLIKDIQNQLTLPERRFLLSVKKGVPNYELMPFAHLDQFSALQWKLRNIKLMTVSKHQIMLTKLQNILGL